MGKHIHVIDGKTTTFDDATCPFCHPEKAQQTTQQQEEVLPRVYRKGNTVVIKISKVTVITLTPYPQANTFLFTFSRMIRDQAGVPIYDDDKNPKWNKMTTRINDPCITAFIHEASILVNEYKPQTAPVQRD